MRQYLKINAEGSAESWTVWFEDAPQIAFSGEWPSAAIDKLLDPLGSDQFDNEGIMAVHEGTRDGHLEFLIPLIGRFKIPQPSVN